MKYIKAQLPGRASRSYPSISINNDVADQLTDAFFKSGGTGSVGTFSLPNKSRSTNMSVSPRLFTDVKLWLEEATCVT